MNKGKEARGRTASRPPSPFDALLELRLEPAS